MSIRRNSLADEVKKNHSNQRSNPVPTHCQSIPIRYHKEPSFHIYQRQSSNLDWHTIDNGLTRIGIGTCQSEDNCACNKGTSALCGKPSSLNGGRFSARDAAWFQSITIRCQSDVNRVPIGCQSDANPMSIQCQSGTNPSKSDCNQAPT